MLNLMKKDLKLWFKSKRIWMFLLGVLIITVIGTSWHAKELKENNTYISIGVVDLDDSEYSKMMISYFEESDLFTSYATVVVGSEEEISRKFLNDDLTMYLVVPKDFAQNLIDIQNVPMKAYINTEDKTRAIILKNMLTAYENYISAVEVNCVALYDVMKQAGMSSDIRSKVNVDISYDLVFTALGKSDFFDFTELKDVKSIPLVTYYGFELLFLLLSYLALFAGMDCLKEARNQTMTRLITTGTKVITILTQKVLLSTALVSILIGIFYIIVNARGIQINASVGVFAVLYFALASVLFMLLSVFFAKIPTFLLISNVFILFGAVLGGGLIPILYLPSNMKMLAKLTPNFWFIDSMLSYQMQEKHLTAVTIVSLLVIIGIGLGITSLCYQRKEGGSHEDI